jgi:hypothetical protein
LFTPEWSATIVVPKSFTAFAVPFVFASSPAALSTAFAVTTMCAIWASLIAGAGAGAIAFALVSAAGAAATGVVVSAAGVSDFEHAASAAEIAMATKEI